MSVIQIIRGLQLDAFIAYCRFLVDPHWLVSLAFHPSQNVKRNGNHSPPPHTPFPARLPLRTPHSTHRIEVASTILGDLLHFVSACYQGSYQDCSTPPPHPPLHPPRRYYISQARDRQCLLDHVTIPPSLGHTTTSAQFVNDNTIKLFYKFSPRGIRKMLQDSWSPERTPAQTKTKRNKRTNK